MGRVVYLPDAIDDLSGIWTYLAEQSGNLEIADRLIDSIDDVATLYAANPELGVQRPELAEGLRCFPVGRYVVFYLLRADAIEIIQIIHGSRDISAHFRRRAN